MYAHRTEFEVRLRTSAAPGRNGIGQIAQGDPQNRIGTEPPAQTGRANWNADRRGVAKGSRFRSSVGAARPDKMAGGAAQGAQTLQGIGCAWRPRPGQETLQRDLRRG